MTNAHIVTCFQYNQVILCANKRSDSKNKYLDIVIFKLLDLLIEIAFVGFGGLGVQQAVIIPKGTNYISHLAAFV